jgi:hypothetical protein
MRLYQKEILYLENIFTSALDIYTIIVKNFDILQNFSSRICSFLALGADPPPGWVTRVIRYIEMQMLFTFI